jgi:hypothetical protein
MEDLLGNLKEKWEQLNVSTQTWLSHLGDKYSKGTDADTKTAREHVTNKRFVLTNFDRQIRQANPATVAQHRDVATITKTYLDTTEAIHFDLTDRCKGDATAEQYASDVQEKRDAVLTQIKLIHNLPLVPDVARPLSGSHAGSGTAVTTTTLGPAGRGGGGVSGGGSPPFTSGSPYGGATLPPILDQPLLLTILIILNPSTGGYEAPVVTQTRAAFDPHGKPQFTATNSMQNLSQSWDKAIAFFVDQFNNVTEDPSAVAGLVELHFELETLYGQLSSIVSETDEESLLSVY